MAKTQAKPKDLSAVVGEQLRMMREGLGLRLDELAATARMLGWLRCTSATLAAIETGRRRVSLEEFAILPLLVYPYQDRDPDLVKRFQTYEGFVAAHSNGPIRCAEAAELEAATLKDAFSGKPLLIPGPIHAEPPGYADAEVKAARALKRASSEVASAAQRVWGQSFTQERDARVEAQAREGAAPRALQAIRGHVTRAMLAELQERFDQSPRLGDPAPAATVNVARDFTIPGMPPPNPQEAMKLAELKRRFATLPEPERTAALNREIEATDWNAVRRNTKQRRKTRRSNTQKRRK